MISHRIGIVGSGRMANALTNYFKNDFEYSCHLWARNKDKGLEVAQAQGAQFCESLSELCKNTSIILIAVKDEAIKEMSFKISNHVKPGCLCIHLSGCLGIECLSDLKNKNASIAIAHPLMTITPGFTDNPLNHAPVGIASENDLVYADIERHLRNKGHLTFRFAKTEKPLYHAAAVISCAGLVELIEMVTKLMHYELNIEKSTAKELIMPLVNQTLNNYLSSTSNYKTGPWVRNDSQVIQKHLKALNSYCCQSEKIYSALLDYSVNEETGDAENV